MADGPWSGRANGNPPVDTDNVCVARGGTNVIYTWTQIKSWFTLAMANVTGLTAALAAKVDSVSGSSPITSSGGVTPDIGLDETVAIGNNARITVRKNTGVDIGTRRRLNLIEGTNITITGGDDAGSEEIDITFAVTAGTSITIGQAIALANHLPLS